MRKLLIAMAIIIGLGASACGNPLKVTDPANPLFDPDKFSFDDYSDRYELIEAFRKLFPVGTPKEFVNRVLVEAGKAGAAQNKNYPMLWHYSEPRQMKHMTMAPQHQFIFDDDGKLLNVEAYATEVLYPDQITHEQMRQELLKKYKQERKSNSSPSDKPDMTFLDTNNEPFGMSTKLNELFPIGTPKEFVDKMLIDVAGAKYKRHLTEAYNYPDEKNIYQYEYQRPLWARGLTNGHYLITIFFDEKNNVSQKVKISGPTGP